MLEAAALVEVNLCAQCSYQSEWAFQLDHHVKRLHSNVNATANDQPEQLFCISCNLNTECNKLESYEYNKHRHGKRRIESDDESVWYNCKRCGLKTHSTLSLTKHLYLCRSKQDVHLKEPIEQKPEELSVGKRPSVKRPRYCTEIISTETREVVLHPTQNDQRLLLVECRPVFRLNYNYVLDREIAKKILIQQPVTAEEITWFACSKCSYRATQEFKLKRHMVLTHASKGFECSKCSFKSQDESIVKLHMSHEHENGWFACSMCTFKAETRGNLESHTNREHPFPFRDAFTCPKCPFTSKNRAKMKGHSRVHIKLEEGKTLDSMTNLRMF